MYLNQDGATPHHSLIDRHLLNQMFSTHGSYNCQDTPIKVSWVISSRDILNQKY